MTRPASFTRLLSDVSGQLGEANDPTAVADVVLPVVVEAFGAAVGSVARFLAPSTLRLVGVVGMEHVPETREAWAEFDVSAGVPLAEAARTGGPVWVEDVETVRERFPAWPADARSRSACVVPMRSGGRLVGVLGLSWPEPRRFTDAEKETLLAVGSIAAAACLLGRHGVGRRLGVVDTDTHRDDVHLAHLVRSVDTAVPRTLGTVGASGAPTLSWLVEAPNDAGLAVAAEGVLALARRQGSTPGAAARGVDLLCEEMDGDAAGVVLQVGPDAAWVSVAAVRSCLVLTAPVVDRANLTAVRGVRSAADEHVVVPDGQGATVLALLLAPDLGTETGERLVEVAAAELVRRRESTADDLLTRVGERLGEHGVDGGLLGALALVVAPRPGTPVLRRRLPARPLAVPLARRFALAALEPDHDDDTAFRLGLAMDELVSNAVRHSEDEIEIVVVPGPQALHVEVSDDDDRPPYAVPARGDDELLESGRGLVLLRSVVDDWGIEPRPRGGKSVWARISR